MQGLALSAGVFLEADQEDPRCLDCGRQISAAHDQRCHLCQLDYDRTHPPETEEDDGPQP